MSGVMFDKILGRIREDGDGGGGSTPKIVTVQYINGIPNAVLKSLNPGDVVVTPQGVAYCVYDVSTAYIYLVKVMNGVVTEVMYRSSDSGDTYTYYTQRDYNILTNVYTSQPQSGMVPNAVYNLGELDADTTFVLAAATDQVHANVWTWTFSTGATVPNITWPQQITMWEGGNQPTIKANTHYVIKVMDGFAVCMTNEPTTAPILSVSITHAALKALRDGGNLVPGTWYRITDYACTTTQQDTQSANHAFDIIVRADDESHLNENAYAAHHEGDTYFANCKLEAWQLKYCLDNDTNRFAWADDENGKGVVYLMKDEWNNECPYDFKNIMFKRVKVSGEYVEGSYDAANFLYLGIPGDIPEVFEVEDESDTIWVYTFNGFDDLEDVTQVRDVSVKGMLTEDERFGGYPDKYHPSNGVMKARQAFQVVDDEDGHEVQLLNNIVFVQMYTMTYNYEVDGYDFNAGCYNMTIGAKRNEGLKFGAHCHDFVIGSGCYGSSFGSKCQYNTFGTDCYTNTFGNYCQYNTFGNDCDSNSFGNNCRENSFGNDCDSNSFGNNCYNNPFGNGFQYNSFGNSCSGNSFGNYCYNNSFGNYCYNNSFGNNCDSNSFGNDCQENSFGNYCQTITVFDGVQNCSVTGGTQQAPVKNAQILNGTAGASAQNKLTIAFAANKAYTQVAAKTTAGNLKVFNPTDLVQ